MDCNDYTCPPPASTGSTTTTTTPAHAAAERELADTGIDLFEMLVFAGLIIAFGLMALAVRLARGPE